MVILNGDVLSTNYYQQLLILRLNLEKAVFKLIQNLISNYSLIISYFSEEWFQAVRGEVVTNVPAEYFKCFICFV